VDEYLPIAKATREEKVRGKYIYKIGSASTLVILKLNSISFSQNLSKSNLLLFSSKVITTSCKTYLAYRLVNSSISPSCIDLHFAKN
jgi:hypothetical protein